MSSCPQQTPSSPTAAGPQEGTWGCPHLFSGAFLRRELCQVPLQAGCCDGEGGHLCSHLNWAEGGRQTAHAGPLGQLAVT